jgi:hypothetical protein
MYLDKSGICYRYLLKGEAPRFSAEFTRPLSCERPFKSWGSNPVHMSSDAYKAMADWLECDASKQKSKIHQPD